MKLLGSIRRFQSNLEQETIVDAQKVIGSNVWVSEPKARFVLLAPEESDGSAESPDSTISKREPLRLGSFYDVYMKLSKAIVSIET